KLLSRWCSQSRLTLNMTVSNRKSSNKALKEAIGDFTEVMLVDFDFSDGSSLKEKAREAQNKISQRKKHGSVASSEIIRDYTAMNGGGNSFPFQAVCTCMLFDLAGSKWDWLGERRYQISQTPQIMLDNQISLKEGKLFIHWDYLGTYFDDDKIKSMQEEYCSIITGTNTQLQKKYNSISEKYNETFREREKNTLVKLFLKQVALHPDKTAISDMFSGFTYKEIDEASDKIADYIIENYSRNEPVIVKMTRSKNAVAAAMGIIKSGGYYIPVAHNCPEKRLEYIMVQSAGSLILTDEKVNEIIGSYKRSRAYDLSEPDNIAYVIYTSGSTGTPKGVVITHDAACNTILDINERMSVTCKDKIIGISSFSFDLSV
ncbi:MAG: AMP-binding protein, partial [Oscillospiraceae bacterium]|nr:AMP-binding protein [Oscillospiraceae bacterium]